MFQIQFVLLISRQGKVRLTKWYSPYTQKERSKVIRELSGVILTRGPKLCNFVEWRGLKVVYKRYASLYFCMCIDQDDNELEVLEIIHHFVEILDRYFGSVCELDLIFNFHKAYYILDELLIAGELQESSKKTVARLIAAQDSLVETAKEQASSISNIIAQATKISRGLDPVKMTNSNVLKSIISTAESSQLKALTHQNEKGDIPPYTYNELQRLTAYLINAGPEIIQPLEKLPNPVRLT
ncbi:unnamed protein product [Dovyalis caffra]|uniref:Adaptor AP-1 19 kDa protein n=1 Tax=Dovyalis caffra TaxID=77055 RepID=A0AAV1SHA5_9ROSI|nr:unnamed protein product [Dovyalis caffra]